MDSEGGFDAFGQGQGLALEGLVETNSRAYGLRTGCESLRDTASSIGSKDSDVHSHQAMQGVLYAGQHDVRIPPVGQTQGRGWV